MKVLGRGWSLTVKLPLTITAVVAGVAFIIGLAVVAEAMHRFRADLEDKALLLGHSIAIKAPEMVLRHDTWSLYKTLRSVASAERDGVAQAPVMTGSIVNPAGIVLAHLDPARHPLGLPLAADPTRAWEDVERIARSSQPGILRGATEDGDFVEAVVPVRSGDEVLGIVLLRLSAAQIAQRVWSAALTVLGWTFALAAAGSVLGTIISLRMVRPLRDLSRGMATVGAGRLAEVVPVRRGDRDEIGALVDSFNTMAGELAEKKRLERELAVGEKIHALGRIAAGVAHEVNNPLAGMLNCIDTMKSRPDDLELPRRYIPLLEKGLFRIQAIVQSLLVELRAEGAEAWGSAACLEDLRDLVEAEIGGRDIRLVWRNEIPADVQVNCHRLQQILLNLFKNAIQAMPDGGRLIFLAHLEAGGGAMVLTVEDTGVGIPEENAQRLFDPFFTQRPGGAGTGLGLWIVYRLVQSLRGAIEVQSEVGKGSLFKVRIPLPEGVEASRERAVSDAMETELQGNVK
ncbi:sensor histidine kinase [Novispirillum sp. DQ9]|uniref:sensor histidine kinase n=1 Tax=Novispirillum sp. DQ9 TaxID=3398612 RepID=UPI003C7B93E6